MNRVSNKRPFALALLLAPLSFFGCFTIEADDDEGDARICSTRQAISEGECVGSATSCPSFSPLTCSQDGCRVDYGDWTTISDDRCKGYPKRCTEYSEERYCEKQDGCKWKVDEDAAPAEDDDFVEDCIDESSGGMGPGSGGMGPGSGGMGPGSGGMGPGSGGMGPGSGGMGPGSGGSAGPPGTGGADDGGMGGSGFGGDDGGMGGGP